MVAEGKHYFPSRPRRFGKRSLGLDITVEDSSRDMAVEFNGNVYLFEFKVVERASAGAVLRQLKARGYAAKYRG